MPVVEKIDKKKAILKQKEKMKMKKMICVLTAAALLVCALTGCGGNKEAVATDGSTSMNKVIGALGEAFENDTGITVTYNATGSGAGIQAVEEGRCDIGLASRVFHPLTSDNLLHYYL